MKSSLFKQQILAVALALSFSNYCMSSLVVSAPDIATQLLTKPKAMKQVNGKWVQPDPSIDLQVPFEFKQSKLTEDGKKQLDQLALAFQQPGLTDAKFELAGHTDKVGGHDYNLKLSRERANAVKEYLVKTHGIVAGRMITQGYGYTRLADAQDPTGAVNRRVEVRHLLQGGYGSLAPAVGYPPASAQVAAPAPAPGYAPAVIVPQQPAQLAPAQPAATFPPQSGGGRLVPRE